VEDLLGKTNDYSTTFCCPRRSSKAQSALKISERAQAIFYTKSKLLRESVRLRRLRACYAVET